jgi:hypothetical protein
MRSLEIFSGGFSFKAFSHLSEILSSVEHLSRPYLSTEILDHLELAQILRMVYHPFDELVGCYGRSFRELCRRSSLEIGWARKVIPQRVVALASEYLDSE